MAESENVANSGENDVGMAQLSQAAIEPGETIGGDYGPGRRGTLEWLLSLPTVEVNGRLLPSVHRCPLDAQWRTDEERGSRCALVKPDGSGCGAPATHRFGVCVIHCGGGADPAAIASKGGASRATIAARARLVRHSFGIQGNSPRSLARAMVAERSADVAAALLAPLDDRKLRSMDRQRAAVAILGETFPLESASLEVSLPASADAVSEMGWSEMRALAASLSDQALTKPG